MEPKPKPVEPEVPPEVPEEPDTEEVPATEEPTQLPAPEKPATKPVDPRAPRPSQPIAEQPRPIRRPSEDDPRPGRER
jgi:hypothetical protein